MALIFGFDIGTTSIGSAVIRHDPKSPTGRILRLGVRIFPETREPKGHAPLNQQRRAKRMMRRQLRRRRDRRRALNEALLAAGLLPAFNSQEWVELMRSDPYELRTRALTEPLLAFEFGRAIYHLAQRRHFRGRDIEPDTAAESEADKDEEAARSEAQDTMKAIRTSGSTLGQWLYETRPSERKRGIHAARAAVEDEFERIWSAQAANLEALSDPPLQDRIRSIIFFQRPVFWRRNTLGLCPLVPGAALCPKGAWLSMQRRMLEKLNNLEFVGAGARPLDADERAAILQSLQTQAGMSWSGVRKALKPLFAKRGIKGEERRLKFNLELGGERGLLGNPIEQRLAKIIGDAWPSHPHKQGIRDALHARLWAADYDTIGEQRVVIRPLRERNRLRREAAESIVRDFDLTETATDDLAAMSFPSGWEPFSVAALERFLPELEAGARFGALIASPEFEAWRDTVFPERERPTGEIQDRLPSPASREESERLRSIRNPTVVRCQNELRKVVNNLIDVYGKPDLIRIELTRDVGRSKRDREEFQKAIRQREAERKAAEKELIANGIARPSRDDIEKWLLWQECNRICPYTSDVIGFDDLFRKGRFEVEHIWPRSRCLDDSFGNRTLCRSDINKEKGNRTPFEYLGHDPDRWHAIQERLNGMLRKGRSPGMPFGKIRRFLATELPDDFTNRQLTDTGYAARESAKMLKRLWADGGPSMPVTVQVVSGKVTAQLRKLWGLNNLLHDGAEKTRADHRHHAIDALVVACTHPGITNQLSRYWQHKDSPRAEAAELPPPWEGIRADAGRMLDRVVVSHRVKRKVSGGLHEETHFGDGGVETVRNGVRYRQFVRRKPVDTLSRSELEKIRDPAIRAKVSAWVESNGGDPKKAFFNGYPRLGEDGPEIRKVRLTEEKRPELTLRLRSGSVDKGNNHHLAVYQDATGKFSFVSVSLKEAREQLKKGKNPVLRKHPDLGHLLFSVAAGDTLAVPYEGGERHWVVTSTWANGQITIQNAVDALGDTKTNPTIKGLIGKGCRKLSVDPIGRVRIAND